ncbi:glycosyltransferase 61 family protein [Tritonibacter mobilis]|uniref:glycosyltransferase 61 family protein n=1 Tax=Tritonibacter mobilis TaxID=379347 RepID=UPI000E0CF598|nr:glycosyltransferase 61 family protein [Tritonibacter mobilis]
MSAAGDLDPTQLPSPKGGWSESMTVLRNVTVVPPVESSMVQAAGLLREDGSYCHEGALWRRHRPITTKPDMPKEITQKIPGRWLWGGVLWAHFGHFLVESTARLWALANLDAPVDGVLFIPKRPAVRDQVRGFQSEFVGLMQKDLPIRVAADPAMVEELVVPGQGFGLGDITEATPKYRNAIHAQFARDIKPEGPEKLYISRSKLGLGKGGLLGEEQMEAYLAAEGYEIYHPQEHSLSAQLARYKAARKVIAADGSALHLYAMVGRPDQKVAMVLRRKSTAHTLLTDNVRHFCKCDPLVIGALRTEWVPKDNQRSSRLSFGELDHSVIGRALKDGGFISGGENWPVLDDDARQNVLKDKGIKSNRFVESPAFQKAREEQERAERRARRAARRTRREAREAAQNDG